MAILALLETKGQSNFDEITLPAVMATPALNIVLKRPKGLPLTYVIRHDGILKAMDIGKAFEEDIVEIGNLVGIRSQWPLGIYILQLELGVRQP